MSAKGEESEDESEEESLQEQSEHESEEEEDGNANEWNRDSAESGKEKNARNRRARPAVREELVLSDPEDDDRAEGNLQMVSVTAADLSGKASSSGDGAARSRSASDREEGEVSSSESEEEDEAGAGVSPSKNGKAPAGASKEAKRPKTRPRQWDQLPSDWTAAQISEYEERRRVVEAAGLAPAPSEQQRREQERVEVKQ